MAELRESGVTLRELGEKYGVSKQRIGQLCKSYNNRTDRFEKRTSKVIYPNIRRFMVENYLTFIDFTNLCGISYTTGFNALTGRHKPNGNTVEGILRATGLTYEEAFKK